MKKTIAILTLLLPACVAPEFETLDVPEHELEGSRPTHPEFDFELDSGASSPELRLTVGDPQAFCRDTCSRSVEDECQSEWSEDGWNFEVEKCIDACEEDSVCSERELEDMRDFCVPLFSIGCTGALICLDQYECQNTFVFED